MLFLCSDIFPQNRKYYDVKSVDRIKQSFSYLPNKNTKGDSLLIDNDIYYFKRSPIIFLEGAEKVVFDNVIVLPEVDVGYNLLWSIEGGKLFIRTINICRTDYTKDVKPTKEEALKKLEVFLGRDFKGNKLFADFVTGKFVLYKYALSLSECGEKWDKYTLEEQNRYKKEIMKQQRVYTVEFNDGILIKLSRNRKFETKLRKYMKGINGTPHILF